MTRKTLFNGDTYETKYRGQRADLNYLLRCVRRGVKFRTNPNGRRYKVEFRWSDEKRWRFLTNTDSRKAAVRRVQQGEAENVATLKQYPHHKHHAIFRVLSIGN